MLHILPPAQSVLEERLNFIPGDQSAVCLLVCRAGFEHCAESVFDGSGFGYLGRTEQHRRGMAQREGSDLGSLVSYKSWSLVELNY